MAKGKMFLVYGKYEGRTQLLARRLSSEEAISFADKMAKETGESTTILEDDGSEWDYEKRGEKLAVQYSSVREKSDLP